MSLAPCTYLVDGPVMGAAARRAAVKNRMVVELMAADAFATLESARRALYAQDFFAIDIELLAGEAMAEAAEFAALTGAVAKLMATA
jgi:hypothetical protein